MLLCVSLHINVTVEFSTVLLYPRQLDNLRLEDASATEVADKAVRGRSDTQPSGFRLVRLREKPCRTVLVVEIAVSYLLYDCMLSIPCVLASSASMTRSGLHQVRALSTKKSSHV